MGHLEAEVVLDRNERAPAEARSFLTARVPHWRRLGDAVLAVSELVTNAVEHAHSGPVRVRLEAIDHIVRVEVASRRGAHPVVIPSDPPPPAEMRGRGLAIVREVADRMGVVAEDETTVWFEMEG